MKKHAFKSKVFLKIVTAFVLVSFLGAACNVNASTNVPELNISASASKPSIYINEEVNITYTVQPQPINQSEINQAANKEIVLVVDISGSMAWSIDYSQSRLEALKKAAKNFIEKFKDEATTKIGIVTYSSNAQDTKGLTNSSSQTELKNVIDSLNSNGATNIGDGIRVANRMLSNGTNAKKYVVLMSDGMPTALSYSGVATGYGYVRETYTKYPNYYRWGDYVQKSKSWSYYENLTDDRNIKYGSYSGSLDPEGYSLEYSTIMAKKLKDSGITSYFIGFSPESNSVKLTQISNSGGGTYYDAKDANSISKVYSEIGDKIKADYTVDNVKLNFTLPDGLSYVNESFDTEINGSTYIKSIPSIEYKLSADRSKYESESFQVKLKLKGIKKGVYELNGPSWNLSYKDLKGVQINKQLPAVSINVEKYSTEFIMTRKLIPETNQGNFNINNEFQMEYTIAPQPIQIESSQKQKEIMLVVDTSGSMAWSIDKDESTKDPVRIKLAKDALNNFISKFNNSENTKIGLVTYASSASVYTSNNNILFDNNNYQAIKDKISKLTPSGGTNIGDGLRKAAGGLLANKDSKKYIVLMTDGQPTHSSRYWVDDDRCFYTELSDPQVGTNIDYVNNEDLALEYSNLMAKIIKENKDLNINTFAIGFSQGANQENLKSIANSAGGTYLDATRNDVNAIDEVYSKIAEEIKTDLSLQNVQFKQQLPDGLVLADSSGNSVTKDLNVNYTYNVTKRQYEAEPITFTIKVRGTKVGVYNLKDDATFNYVDLDGTPTTKKFDPIRVSIIDSYVIKQGLFQPGGKNPRETYIGEENIKYMTNSALTISPNMEYKLAAFLRTSGQQTELSIKLNSNNNSNITSMGVASVTIYLIGEDGTIKPTEIKGEVLNDNGKNPIIKVKLNEESTNGYKYYIINYNYKINEISNLTDSNSITILNKVEILNTDKNNDFTTEIVSMPDVF